MCGDGDSGTSTERIAAMRQASSHLNTQAPEEQGCVVGMLAVTLCFGDLVRLMTFLHFPVSGLQGLFLERKQMML